MTAHHSPIRAMIMVFLILAHISCNSGVNKETNSLCSWPAALSGRTLQFESDRYVLYGADGQISSTMKTWIDTALEVFEQRYHCKLEGQGLILIMEQAEDPSTALLDWHDRNVDRSRAIQWTSPIRNQRFTSAHGRPYCLFDKPYFRESFAIPASIGRDLVGLPSSPGCRPAWVCLLASDEYVRDAARAKLQSMPVNDPGLREVPAVVRLLSGAAGALMMHVQGRLINDHIERDIELMRLQREEVLRRSLLEQSCGQMETKVDVLLSLQDEIDARWKRIWEHRIID